MPPAARITDPTTHGMPLAPGPGSVDVLIGGLPAWRATVDQHVCPAVSITGADGVGSVLMGSPTVLINGMMACRAGDIVVEIPGLAMGPANPIVMGCPTVMIGEVGMGGVGTPQAATMQQPLDSVSLAAEEGDSQTKQDARRRLARDFYLLHCPEMLANPTILEDHLAGIDFTLPVLVVELKGASAGLKVGRLWQWQWYDAEQPGQYFSPTANVAPEELGTLDRTADNDWETGRLYYEKRQLRSYAVASSPEEPPVLALQSTAAPIKDRWTGRSEDTEGNIFLRYPRRSRAMQGGATQLFIPRVSHCRLTPATGFRR